MSNNSYLTIPNAFSTKTNNLFIDFLFFLGYLKLGFNDYTADLLGFSKTNFLCDLFFQHNILHCIKFALFELENNKLDVLFFHLT